MLRATALNAERFQAATRSESSSAKPGRGCCFRIARHPPKIPPGSKGNVVTSRVKGSDVVPGIKGENRSSVIAGPQVREGPGVPSVE